MGKPNEAALRAEATLQVLQRALAEAGITLAPNSSSREVARGVVHVRIAAPPNDAIERTRIVATVKLPNAIDVASTI